MHTPEDVVARLEAALSDRYHIEREIGAGGMAAVYLAKDLKHDRRVAIKVMRPDLVAVMGTERFLAEIRTTANFQHPHILPLFDSGEEDGFLFYVMPYVEGESLREKLDREGELPIGEAVRYLGQVVDALAAAHARGVVHRDIKPGNVMLSGRHALVTDFGVAKAVSEAAGHRELTTVGMALGTPAYMAPEQAAGDPHVDHRADIYAVGALAYELLTGRPPFTGRTQQELLAAQVTRLPEPIRTYRAAVPPALEQLIQKCLEKNPADRWQSAEDLLPRLESLATPSGGVTPTGIRPTNRAVRRGWILTGTALAVIAIVGMIAVFRGMPRGPGDSLDPDRIVVTVFEDATGDADLEEVGGMAGNFITQGLQSTGTLRVVPWQTALQATRWVKAQGESGEIRDPIRAIAEETGAGIVVSGAVYLDEDTILIQADVTDARRGVLLGALEPVGGPRASPNDVISDLRRLIMGFMAVRFDERLAAPANMSGRPPPFGAYKAFAEGISAYIDSDHSRALPHLQRAHELDPSWAEALLFLVATNYNLGELGAADTLLAEVPQLGGTLTPYHRAYLEFLQALVDGDNQRALMAIRRAAAMAPGSRAWYGYGWQAVRMNRPNEAIDALSTLDQERGAMRGYSSYSVTLAMTLHMLGESDEALQLLRRVREPHPQGLRRQENVVVRILASLGRVGELTELLAEGSPGLQPGPRLRQHVRALEALYDAGHLPEAQSLLRETIRQLESRPSEEAETPDHRRTYARALFLDGRAAEAKGIMDRLLEERPGEWPDRADRGFFAAESGDTAVALADMEWLGTLNQPYLLGAHTAQRAWIAGALGRREQAMDLLRQAYAEGYVDWGGFWREFKFAPLRDYPAFRELMKAKG